MKGSDILLRLLCLSFVLLFYSCGKEEIDAQKNRITSGTDLIGFHVVIEGKEYFPVDTLGQDLTVFVPEGFDLSKIIVKFSHNAKKITVNHRDLQLKQECLCDFSDYINGTLFILTSDKGDTKTYTVRVLDTHLPIVSVSTENHTEIIDKENWLLSNVTVMEVLGGRVEYEAETRGRGNQTWKAYPKKPYAIKLKKKDGFLGMPKGKRWDLLALYRGFIGNAFAFEAARMAPAIEWSPRGRFVEMVLNGKYQGLYYICEHIKIDKDRVNISELKKEDVDYPSISGGYLLECDELYDEEYKFKSTYFNMPYMLKSPDEDVPESQFNYIQNFINELEAELMKIGTDKISHYSDFLDVDNFADYWMALEMVNNYEAFKPRSVKMYKGRDGVDSSEGTICKLKAGPLWDQEVLLMNFEFYSNYSHYFHQLFKDEAFVKKVKERWEIYKAIVLGNKDDVSLLDFTKSMYANIKRSADRDIDYWDNPYFTLDAEYENVVNKLEARIQWMDGAIKNMQPIE